MSGTDGIPSAGVCDAAAAYVLGSLSDGEVRAFTRHLDACVVCHDEVQELQSVVGILAMAAPQHRAPDRLRRETIRAIRKHSEPRPRSWRRGVARPVLRPGRGLALGAALASGCAVTGTVAILLLAAGGQAVRLVPARVTDGRGEAQVQLSDRHSALVVHRLPPPLPGHVYEVWLQRPDRPPASANVLFSVTSKGDADLGLPATVRGASRLLVTEEPDGGSPAPTSAPVIVARLT